MNWYWYVYIAAFALAILDVYLDIHQSEKDFAAGAVEANSEKANDRPSAFRLLLNDLPWFGVVVTFAIVSSYTVRSVLTGGVVVAGVLAIKHFKGYLVGLKWWKTNKK